MKAYPEKFLAIYIGKGAYEIIDSFEVQGINVKRVSCMVFFGMNIDYILKMDKHVSEICLKAQKQLAVLKRIRIVLTKQGKMTIYSSFIISNLIFAP